MNDWIEAHDAYFDGDDEEPETAEPLWRAVPDPAPAPDPVTSPELPGVPMDPAFIDHPAAVAAIKAVLSVASYGELALASRALQFDTPFKNKLGFDGFLSDLDQEVRRLEIRDKAERQYRAKIAARDAEEWAPVDLFAAETEVAVAPEILYRTDGHALFYRGKLHNIVGESESGKTWFAMGACLSEVRAAGHALYIDYEDQGSTFIRRLRVLGATDDEIRRVTYVSVEKRWDQAPEVLLGRYSPTFVVLDGVTEGMTSMGLDPIGTPDAAAWVAWVRHWKHTGAAVTTIDHVVKDKSGQGRFGIGSQHKMAGIDGCHYVVEPSGVLRPGQVNAVHLKVGKDRSGGVREHAGEAGDNRTQYAGTFRFGLPGGAYEVVLNAPEVEEDLELPDGLLLGGSDSMFVRELIRYLEEVGEATMTAIEKHVSGASTNRKRRMVRILEGSILERSVGARGWTFYRLSETPPEASS